MSDKPMPAWAVTFRDTLLAEIDKTRVAFLGRIDRLHAHIDEQANLIGAISDMQWQIAQLEAQVEEWRKGRDT